MALLRLPYEIEITIKRKQRKQYSVIKFEGLKFRIIKTAKGWISEIAEKNFWGKTIWKPFIKYSGLDKAYPYSSDEAVLNAIQSLFEEETKKQFYRYR